MFCINLHNFFADAGEWFLSWPHPKDFKRKPFREWGR